MKNCCSKAHNAAILQMANSIERGLDEIEKAEKLASCTAETNALRQARWLICKAMAMNWEEQK